MPISFSRSFITRADRGTELHPTAATQPHEHCMHSAVSLTAYMKSPQTYKTILKACPNVSRQTNPHQFTSPSSHQKGTSSKMPPTLSQAHAIMRAVTIDVWNQSSKSERISLLETYCSPGMKAYAPDGSETTGFEEVSNPFRIRIQAETITQETGSRVLT